MSVTDTWSTWSGTASSNSPGPTAIIEMDAELRNVKAQTKTNCVDMTNPQTVGGVKTFSSFPVTPSSAPTTDYQVTNKKFFDDNAVKLTGDQTVAGIKTFSSFPITPSMSPDADYEVANKKYVDGKYFPEVILKHTAATTVPGGGQASGSWATRTLNTEAVDTDDICTLVANQFTLPAGTYTIDGDFQFYNVNSAQCRLYDVTGGAVKTGVGANAIYSVAVAAAGGNAVISSMKDRFTLSGSTTLRIESAVNTTNTTNGWGANTNFGTPEVYGIVRMVKVV